jgi:formate-dependent nitrite reductase membrane component NrfD
MMEQSPSESDPTPLLPTPVGEVGYDAIPMLKRPLWGWEIAIYFFAEGISSGCFVLASVADICGNGRYRRVIRTARYTSLLTVAPCAPLLIHDLGRPERFHHMMRIFKPLSPMNLGAWALSGFALSVTVLALSESERALPAWSRRLLAWAPPRAVSVIGLPFAFIMMSYPGVLLSATSTPVWARSRMMGALLGSCSMSTAASALALATTLDRQADPCTCGAIDRIQSAAHVCEAGLATAYLCQSGRAADPLTRGSYARMFWLGAIGCGLALPAIAGVVRRKKESRGSTIASALMTLAGGLALKWAVVYAGRESALDPSYNRRVTQPAPDNPGWQPTIPALRER